MLGARLRQRLAIPFHPSPTGLLDTGLYVARVGVVNMFLYAYGAGQMLAIDSTTGGGALFRALRRLNIEAERVSALFLTHGDADHTGGLSAFPNATIYLGAGDASLVEGRIRRTLGILKAPRLTSPYQTLVDGQQVDLGGALVKALALPGHTPGSTCYLVDGRILFTGDLLSLQGGRAVPLARFFSMDWVMQRDSAHRLATMPWDGVEWLCTAHSGCTRDLQGALAPLLVLS